MEQENCNWFVFYKDQILILQTENGYHVPCCTEPPVAVPIGSTIHTIGEMNGLPCKPILCTPPFRVPKVRQDR